MLSLENVEESEIFFVKNDDFNGNQIKSKYNQFEAISFFLKKFFVSNP